VARTGRRGSRPKGQQKSRSLAASEKIRANISMLCTKRFRYQVIKLHALVLGCATPIINDSNFNNWVNDFYFFRLDFRIISRQCQLHYSLPLLHLAGAKKISVPVKFSAMEFLGLQAGGLATRS
jgi:hypothetical protein